MANALYQKFHIKDQGAWVLSFTDPRPAYADGSSYYTGYQFDVHTGVFTLTGSTFPDTTQEQRTGYRLSGSTPMQIFTYLDGTLQNGKNLLCTGTVSYLPDRPGRYQKAGLVGTVELPYGSVPEDGVQGGYWYVFQRMATPLWAKAGGVWYRGNALSGKVGGVWQSETKLSARINGIWQ